MKKTYSLLIAALAVTCLATPVQAANHYGSIFGGAVWMNDSALNTGMTGTAALGCDYGSTRLEAEVGWQNNDIDFNNDDVNLYTLMSNGYYDVDLGGVDLYGTVGVGVAETSSPNYYRGDRTDLAYQFGAGIAAPIANKVKLDARYRYFTTIDNPSLSSHSALLGVQVGF